MADFTNDPTPAEMVASKNRTIELKKILKNKIFLVTNYNLELIY